MKTQQEASIQEVLAGLVEPSRSTTSKNGFCVLRIKARGHRDLVHVVGHAAIISAGESVAAAGRLDQRAQIPAADKVLFEYQKLSAEVFVGNRIPWAYGLLSKDKRIQVLRGPRVTMGRTSRLCPSSTTRAISAARRNGAPSIRPAAGQSCRHYLFLLLGVGRHTLHRRRLALCIGVHRLQRQTTGVRPSSRSNLHGIPCASH